MGRMTPDRIETWTIFALNKLEQLAEGMIYLFTWEDVEIGDDVDIDEISYSGGWYMGYRRIIEEHVLVGGIMGYERNASTLSGSDVNGEYSIANYTFAGEAAFAYIARPKFRLYSGGGIGFKVCHHTYDQQSGPVHKANLIEPALHLSYLGFSIGEEAAFTMEWGFGYKGMLNFGLSLRFE